MSVTVVERNTSGDGSDEINGVGLRTRIFQVNLPQDPALLAQDDVSGLKVPRLGDRHHIRTDLTCIKVDPKYEPGSIGYTAVTCTYAVDGLSGTLLPPEFKGWTVDYKIVPVEYPYWVFDPTYKTIAVPGANGPTRQDIAAWEAKKAQGARQCHMVVIRPVRIDNISISFLDEVARQQDKLHRFSGYWYHFVCGPMSQFKRNSWEMTYTWERDPGVPLLPAVDRTRFPNMLTTRDIVPGGYSWQGDGDAIGYARPPYHQWTTLPAAQPPLNVTLTPQMTQYWPQYAVQQQYVVGNSVPGYEGYAGDGWRTLPGMRL